MARKPLRKQLEAAATAQAVNKTASNKHIDNSHSPHSPEASAPTPPTKKFDVFGDMPMFKRARLLQGPSLRIEFKECGKVKSIVKPKAMLIKFSKFAREQLPKPEDQESTKTHLSKSAYATIERPPKPSPTTQIDILRLPDEKVYQNGLVHVFQWMEKACRTGNGEGLTPTDDFALNVRVLQVIKTLGLYGCERRFEGAIKEYISHKYLTAADVKCVWDEFEDDEAMQKHLVHNIAYCGLHLADKWADCGAVRAYVDTKEGLYEMVDAKLAKLQDAEAKHEAFLKREKRKQDEMLRQARQDAYCANQEAQRRERREAARMGLRALSEHEVRFGIGL